MKFKNLITAVGAFAVAASSFIPPSVSAQAFQTQPQARVALAPVANASPCQCAASLMNTQASVKFAQYPANTDWNGTVTPAVEMPAGSNTSQWNNPQRFNVDIQASKLRVEFARDATYGQGSPGSQFTFTLHPVAPPPCGAAKVAGISVSTNRADAASYVLSQSSFSAVNNTVTLAFGNQGSSPFADWRTNDWIEAQLKFDCATAQSSQVVTPMVTGPIDGCTPFNLCFNVQSIVISPGNPTVNLSLQLTQNGLPVGQPLTQSTSVSGPVCFPIPAVLPGQGYDYVLTETHNFTGNSPVTNTIQSPVPGQNNDLVCSAQAASTCCPPVNHNMVVGMFGHIGNSASTYLQPLDTASAATNSFVNGLNAYFAYVKFLCPQIAALKVEFFTGTVAPPSVPGGPAGPLGSMPPTSWLNWNTSTVNVAGLNASLSAMNSFAHTNGLYYRITVKITGVDANGQVVNCGFDAQACGADDTFGFMYNTTAKMAPGSVSPYTK